MTRLTDEAKNAILEGRAFNLTEDRSYDIVIEFGTVDRGGRIPATVYMVDVATGMKVIQLEEVRITPGASLTIGRLRDAFKFTMTNG